MGAVNPNAIPVVGWTIDLVVSASMAIPFWIIWTWCGLGALYFRLLAAEVADTSVLSLRRSVHRRSDCIQHIYSKACESHKRINAR